MDSSSDKDGTGPSLGSEASADVASEAVPCTDNGQLCDSFTVCCGGGSCLSSPGGSVCGFDGGGMACLVTGQPCGSEPCCEGNDNCGEGTTNICN